MVFFEVSFCFVAIIRVLLRLKFKLIKGYGKMLDNCYKYTLSLRLLNFIILTANFYTNKT